MNDWNIQARAHACQACHKGFVDRQPYHTLLFDQRQAYERLDICEGCWLEQHSQGASDRKGFISHWQGIYQAPASAPPEPIQKENAESLLRKLMERNDAQHAPASFILAVMLERKRLLKVKEQLRRDGQRVFIYEHPRSGDLFTIPDPNLQLNQLEAVQRDVAALLEQGLPETSNLTPLPRLAGAASDSSPAIGSPEASAAPSDPFLARPGPVETGVSAGGDSSSKLA